jgi:MFS family permease
VTEAGTAGRPSAALRQVLVPLALAQFICSFAGTNMNVMINDMSKDLDTTVQGIQVAITIFLLVMAALMIPGGKLTDRYGRKRCFTVGLIVYAIGALLSAAGGVGGASGPLIGGLITEAISWRAAFVFQALVIAVIVWLARRVHDPLPADPTRPFDTGGAILSAVGLVLVVMGILAADNNGWLMLALLVVGALVLAWFFRWIRAKERAGREPLLSTGLFRNRTSNLGLVTQNTQWLLLMGVSFVVAAYLQVVRGYDAIQTGVIFTAATAGLLASSLAAERLAKRRPQRTLIMAGFLVTIAGIGLLLAMVIGNPNVWAFAPGLLLIGLGLGLMLTPSVNVVQSAFPEERQGEISGLSRNVSNLGSSLGTAIAGTILVAGITVTPERSYGLAMIVLAAVGLVGLAASLLLPRTPAPAAATASRP